MKILKIANYLFKSIVRDGSNLFWLLVFPCILLVIMMTIFPPLYEPRNVVFNLTLFSQRGTFSGIIERVFDEISKGENRIFQLKKIPDSEMALREELERLKSKKVDIILEIPEDFDTKMLNWFMLKNMGFTAPTPTINIYSLKHHTVSQSAYIVVKNIIQKLEFEFLKKIGYKIRDLDSMVEIVGTKETFSFIDYIYPGIVIFTIFMTALFGIGVDMTWLREMGIMRRINVTVLSTQEFITSYLISRLYLIALQITLVSIMAKFVYKTSINPLSSVFLLYVFLAVVCLSSFGFFIASVSKTTNSANAITQVLNFPLQFLGGLYFPITSVPWVIRWIVIINPITYLASGIRDSLGVMRSPYPTILTILVPLLWSIFFISLTIKRFSQGEL